MNFESITTAPIHLLISGTVLLVLTTIFFITFFFPGLQLGLRLKSLVDALNSDKYNKVLNPEQLGSAFDVFAKSDQMQHLWREHKKTLYSTYSEQGGIETPRWHATVAAEAIWNGQLAVDGRLKTDFFKHLPGIFTGLGIIGTFLGLIAGLRQFEVSSEADVVRKSLETLMHSVGEAFLISAAAIGAAMVVTFLEKLLLSSLYTKVDSIAQILDARFPYSAPEDILKKTEGYAEESATQLKQLKTELVKELRPVLIEMSEAQSKTLERLTTSLERRFEHVGQSQIDASRANNTELGTTISQAISSGLSAPLDEIKDAVKKASGDQSQSAVSMLQDVMTSFSQKLNDLFGGQISGINDLNQRTAETMQLAVGKLSELVESLQSAGKSSTEAMAEHMARALSDMEARQSEMARTTQALVDELKQAIAVSQSTTKDSVETVTSEMARRMAEAIEKMELRQSALNETNKELIAQINSLVSTSQSETNAKLQEVLGSLEIQLGKMLGSFQATQDKAIADGQVREQANTEKTQAIVGSMVSSVEDLNQKTAETIQLAVGEFGGLVENLQTVGKSSTEAMAEHMARALSDVEARQNKMAHATQGLVDELKQAIVMSQSATKDNVETATSEMARRMAEAIEKMELRQSALNETNKELITQINSLVSTSQSETNAKLQEVLGSLEIQLGKMLGSFQATQDKAIADGQVREQANTEKTQAIVGSMVSSVEDLIRQISDASTQMQASVATLAATTTSAIDGMSEGARLVNAASHNFSSSSDKVTSAMGQATAVSSKLADVSTTLATASSSLQSSVGDYRLHREAMGSMVEELRGLVANAKTDVSISSTVLQRIEQASAKLSQAQLQTEQFLSGVAVVLGKAHEEFRTSVTNSLSKSNHEFQQKLASAVGMLSASIKELDDVLATATPQGRKP